MKSILGASWRTTLLGILGAIATACWPLIETGQFDIHKDWTALVKAAGIAVFGIFVKDMNVTHSKPTEEDPTENIYKPSKN